jgi:hypothetical protein
MGRGWKVTLKVLTAWHNWTSVICTVKLPLLLTVMVCEVAPVFQS